MRIPVADGDAEFTGIELSGMRHLGTSVDGKRVSFGDGNPVRAELWSLDNLLVKRANPRNKN